VVIAARRVEQGATVVQRISALGGEAHFVSADVSRAADVQNMVTAAVARFGRLDCAVNNAGIAGPVRTLVADVTEPEWDELMGANLRGVWLCMKHEIPAMLANGGGAIVNVASIYGCKPSDIGHAPYSASKFGVVGLTKSAAVDYGQTSIRINAVAPGFTRSEMVDPARPGAAERYKVLTARHSGMNRLGEAEETANAIRLVVLGGRGLRERCRALRRRRVYDAALLTCGDGDVHSRVQDDVGGLCRKSFCGSTVPRSKRPAE
jgi:NAD(P)-dependent dehydrogenase (short-subunit alcohol dehydrogenase family)